MNRHAKQVTISGLLVAVGLVLPMVFHTFALGGAVFLPMHIPVLLGGFLLSPLYAILVGVITPLVSSILTGMPPFFPIAIQMMFELGVYGLVISYLYNHRKSSLYPAMLCGMLAGRLTAGIVNYLFLTKFLNQFFSLKVFLTAQFITALPGILLQLVMLPIMVKLLETAAIPVGRKGELHGR